MKVHQRVTLLPPHSGGALGRRGPFRVAQSAIRMRGWKMSVEPFLLNTKECASMWPSHCTKCANSVLTNVVPKRARLRVVIWRSRVEGSSGLKEQSFAKWTDSRPSCLKHMGNLMHFSCKCPGGKRYKTWEATIERQCDLDDLQNSYIQDKKQRQWRQRKRRRRRRRSKRHKQRETDIFILFCLETWHQCWTLTYSDIFILFINNRYDKCTSKHAMVRPPVSKTLNSNQLYST